MYLNGKKVETSSNKMFKLPPFALMQNSQSGATFSTRSQGRPKHLNMRRVKHLHKVAKHIKRAQF